MTNHRIRVKGPAAVMLDVATAVADADGIDLVSSADPVAGNADTVTLDVTVDGTSDAVSGAVVRIRAGLPRGASIELLEP